MPNDHLRRVTKWWPYLIWVLTSAILVQIWFCYKSDALIPIGSEPAEGMSRAFAQLILIGIGLLSLLFSVISFMISNSTFRYGILFILIGTMIFLAFFP